jgi:hypothetical protein
MRSLPERVKPSNSSSSESSMVSLLSSVGIGEVGARPYSLCQAGFGEKSAVSFVPNSLRLLVSILEVDEL